MIMFAVAGALAYVGLGCEEDPSFTIKTMLIQAQWPGASAEEVTQQVTDRIEKKLQELDNLEHTRSITTAGQTTVFVDLLPDTNARDVKPTWSRVRNLIDDIKHEFPQGVVGPLFDDQFGDVYGNIFAFRATALPEERDFAENADADPEDPRRRQVDVVGAQDEVSTSSSPPARLPPSHHRSIIISRCRLKTHAVGFVETTGARRCGLRAPISRTPCVGSISGRHFPR